MKWNFFFFQFYNIVLLLFILLSINLDWVKITAHKQTIFSNNISQQLSDYLRMNQQQSTEFNSPLCALSQTSETTQQSFKSCNCNISNEKLHRILESNEEIIKSQIKLIKVLRNDLANMEERAKVAESQVIILRDAINTSQNHQIDYLSKRIIQLEQTISEIKVNYAVEKQQDLVNQLSSSKSIKSWKMINDYINKQNCGNYVSTQLMEFDQEYFSRRRKNSEDQSSLAPPWQKCIDLYSNDPQKFKDKTIGYSKKFIPHELRDKVWPLLFHNNLAITKGLYIQLLEYRNNKVMSDKIVNQISKDLQRSFCGKTEYENRTGLQLEVAQVLQLFHIHRPDVSYVQGMTYPVIVLVLVVGKIKAFRIFLNIILGNQFHRKFFAFDKDSINAYCRTFEKLLKDQNPQVYNKVVNELSIQSEIFLIQWFFTFFCRGMSFESTLKIWDLYAYQNQVVFYKLALCIFSSQSEKLKKSTYQQAIQYVRNFSDYLDQSKLISQVVNHKLTAQKLDSCYKKCRLAIDHVSQ